MKAVGPAMDAETVDLLVLGGGMAGLSAAARVAAEGGSVVLVEKAERTGGSARFAGFVWTAPTVEELHRVNPDGDPELAEALIDGFADGIAWIRSLGVECRPPVPVLGFGRGHQVDTNHYLDTCERLIRDGGHEVLTATRTHALLTENGAVRGAECLLPDGSVRRIEATWTLLATGGFQGDPALRAEHLHPRAADIGLRANPHSVGDGLALGRAAGAAFGKKDAGFYGHLMPAGVPLADPARFVDLALYYSEHALLFDTTGERFVDETVGDHLTTMALLDRPGARGLLVADARVHREWISASYVEGIPGVDKFQLCHRAGARSAVAESLDDFASMPEEWGYPGAVIRDRIKEFNATTSGDSAPAPGRLLDGRPLDEPPFYVVEAAPAITFAFGGLLIDTGAHALSADAGGHHPIPGLLAAGADAGGLYRHAYAGGLAPALVFGLAAAHTALNEAPAPARP
ncbi:FAD binding domain protein [Streptomyces turgidiscabies Car8]|uniref:FAD binding domain protein n=2 Tax=Streptomyces TaxID=1883 RepID=L7EXV3_STRT8|nr:FAD binding domain protein [Streptomyces turgidiscabies Car8]GAQ75249.1 fumarate reductase flavoprotein subunit [Streptomyces turgidiscabies]